MDLDGILRRFFNSVDGRAAPQAAGCPSVAGVVELDDGIAVEFADGTRVSVPDSGALKDFDPGLENSNRRADLLYAIVKRVFATSISRKTGEVEAEGLDGGLARLLKSMTRPAETVHIPVTEGGPRVSAEPGPKTTRFDYGRPTAASKISKLLNGGALEAPGRNKAAPPPKKKFKDMTQDEKRAYWREQKRKARRGPDVFPESRRTGSFPETWQKKRKPAGSTSC